MNTKPLHNVRFQVSLSNGETFYEGKGEYSDLPGQLSPWQRLERYTLEKKLSITSLSLYTEDGQTFNLPSSGKNPKFQIFTKLEKPLDYNVCRYLARDIDQDGAKISDLFTVAEAIYPTYKLQIWVDEKNVRNSWAAVIPL
jgi:hypothetical protein